MTRRRILWLVLASLVVTVVVVATAAVVLVPRYARQLAVWQLQSLTGRPVVIQALDLNLTTGEFSLRGLRVTDRDGGLLAELDRLEGRFHRRSLLQLHLWIESLTLTNGHVRIVRLGPNLFNISDLLDRPTSDRRLFDVSVDRFTIAGGWVELEDRVLVPARTWRSDDIRLDARDVTTLASRGTAFGSTTIAGALVTVRVEQLRLAPVHLRAAVNLRDLDLRLLALYLPGDGPVTLERGTVAAAFTIGVDGRDGTRLDAEAVIERLALKRRGAEGDAVSAPELRLLVRELHQRPGSTMLRYASLGGSLTVLDPTTTPPRPLTFSDLTVTASGIEEATKTTARVAVHASVPGGGEVDVSGTADLSPRRADMRVRARGIELATLARYLPIQGRLTGVGTADVRVMASQAPAFALAVTGEARLDRPALGDGSRTLVSATRVTATDLAYTWPVRVAVGQLSVTQPSATLERDAAGAINLAALFRPADEAPLGSAPAAQTSPAPGTGPRTPAPDIRIAQLKIDDGQALITDASSRSRVEVKNLALTGRNVTWPGAGTADLDLSAAVAGAAATARGTVDPAGRRAEVTLGVGGADLALLRPWLPLAARVDGTLSRADLRVTASYDTALALAVTGDAAIERLVLADGARRPVSVARVAAKGIDYAWPATVRVADLGLVDPSIAVERDAAGTLDIAALLRRAPALSGTTTEETPPDSTPQVTVTRLHVSNGTAGFTDAARSATAKVANLAFVGEDISWPPKGTARVRLTADVAGGQVTARGTVDGARQTGELAVTLKGADLATLQPWLAITGRLRGSAEADLKGTVELTPFTLAMRGQVGVADLAFLEGTRPLLTVGRIDADAVDVQWPVSVAIGRLRVNTPWAQIDRTPQGELSLRALFKPPPGRSGPARSEPVAAGLVPGLEVSVREAVFENGGANIVDDAVEPAARFELRGSRLELRNLTWPTRTPAVVQLTTPMPGSGTLTARGTLSVEPTRLQLEASLDQVDLGPGRPYLPFDARVNGKLTGKARINGTFGETITLVVDADAALDRVALGDGDRRLATAQRVDLTGVRYEYPTRLRIRELVLIKPWALAERKSDGTLELLTLLTQPRRPPPTTSSPAQPVAAASGAAPASGLRVAVNKLSLSDGFVRFVDRTTEPDYAEELSNVILSAEGLGTNPRRHGTIDLRGRLASGHALTVQGQIGGFAGPRFLDLTVNVKEFPVPRLNPYLDQLSSWIARQGTLTAALRYKLDGEELDAVNDVTLNALELQGGGRGNEVQRRVGLPLNLLVSLLKDGQGVIRLNIPVRGRLSAPDFDYGDAVWAAVRGLAIKLVSLPFSWIGNLFYTEDARIESVQVFPVPFEVAKAAPSSFGRDQIQRLATFLKEQPAIRLRLRPVTTVADVNVLRREALNARLAPAGADAAARRQAALALYTELFPRRQPPATDEALLDELVRETPTPSGALRKLATDRTTTVRDGLTRGGVVADRLEPAESRAAVESEGEGRVEFEIVR